ncbi:MAG: hypothetical protein JO117_11260 [Verrucomicrobia bacterium]|nr:hypothetical protein [Verrucomicrobiota bacterium]
MKNHTFRALTVGLCLLGLTTVGAQAAIPGHPRVNEVNARLANQQTRINNGIASGQINSAEAARLQQREANIQARENRDLAAHNGHLTRGETARLNRAENRASRAIHRDRHN